jgi:hypothetical protein
MDRHDEPPEDRATASGTYPLGRLWRAIETATTHPDPAVRHHAEEKALAWESVLSGMAEGRIRPGSRTPVADTPAWVTLEVAHGGFATGRYLAEGPLDERERELLALLPADVVGATDRRRLNRWFLTDDGLGQLNRALHDRTYTIELPEHGALLVVAWLVANDHDVLALDLVAELHPLMDRLRFYPTLTGEPSASPAVVHVRSVGEVAAQLRAIRTPHQVAAMNEALLVWHPLYDRLVDLWRQTIDDDWPCRRWPPDWSDRRSQWLADYAAATSSPTRCTDHRRPRSNFSILRSALDACPDDSSALTGREVGRIRMVLDRSVARWGAPGSDDLRALRARQRGWATRPTSAQIAAAVAERVAPLPQDGGLAEPSAVLHPVERNGGTHAVPSGIVRKVERAREAPVAELVAAAIIPSTEVLATVLPQITSHVAAGAFARPELRDIYAPLYEAFRRRRSLLLLNLEHQVRIEELPWVRVLEPFRETTPDTADRARRTLREAALLTLTSFPQTILPNPMVREMSALAKQADLAIPFVEEVAADIFMGTFTVKWREAAALAASVMAGTPYARYYDLPEAATWTSRPPQRPRRGLVRRGGKPTAEDFAAACSVRAREAATGDGSRVARNGAIIEQSQILTTHNLAPLVEGLELHDEIAGRAIDLACAAFAWIVDEQNTDYRTAGAKLQMVKNTAYAWRQAIFFLSLAPPSDQAAAVHALRALAEERPIGWRRRFEPAIAGLEAVVQGDRFDSAGRLRTARRFLGWSIGPHWLLPKAGY